MKEQSREEKIKKLKYRIIRDITFIILGIIFLTISILVEVKKQNDEKTKPKNTTSTTEHRKTYLE